MKIGVMLRTMDGPGGIGVYTRNLMDHLLPLDENSQYVLFYRNPDFLGRYARYGHVREKLVRATNTATWDQVSIPLEAHREGVRSFSGGSTCSTFAAPCPSIAAGRPPSWRIPT